MKKTLTINLGGIVFHIDEDAYQLLDKYLSNLRIHFKEEEGSDEIMNDFEMRISELFNERIRLGYEVITLEEVENVIKRMGRPEELFDTETDEEGNSNKSKNANEGQEKQRVRRRLFRNPDDRMLGGVAGGLAALLGWDPSVVRILFFLSPFLTQGFSIVIYIFLWIILPEAKTAAEKLQMHGESVTVENIGKTVTNGFDKTSEKELDKQSQLKQRTLFQKILDGFVWSVALLLKVLFILLAIVLFPPLLILLFVLFILVITLLFGGGFGLLYSLLPNIHWGTFAFFPNEGLLAAAGICSILIIAIPLVAIIYLILNQLFKYKPVPNGVKWTFFILWIIALVVNIILAVKFGLPFIGGEEPNGHWGLSWDTIQLLSRL